MKRRKTFLDGINGIYANMKKTNGFYQELKKNINGCRANILKAHQYPSLNF
jgi:hypothetical protein